MLAAESIEKTVIWTEESANMVQKVKKRKRRRNKVSLINTSNCRYELVRFVAQKFGIKESAENWNVFWTDLSTSVQRCKDMKRYQRINHFPGMLEICRKDSLARNLNRLYKAFPAEYDIFPKTWCLPSDIADVAEYAKSHRGRCFIVKPDLGCQGRGIAITRNINQLKTYERMICQLYIHRPFLIDGFKFDLRIYTLITSCDPLRIFVYNEGLARFATVQYKEPNSQNATNMYMHLTNYSVNKHSRAYNVDDIEGSKRKLSTINQWFQANNYSVSKIWSSIDDVIIKTIVVSLPTLKHYYHTCFPNHTSSHACFEILGMDFMFDSDLKPFVLEVNHSPSFHTDTPIDHDVKEALLHDTFNILNLAHNDRAKILNEDKKRIRERLLAVAYHSPDWTKDSSDDLITQHRIEWENSHMGNYRKIYPNARSDYYDKFVAARQNAMLAETMTPKQKETAAKLAGESPRQFKKPPKEVETAKAKIPKIVRCSFAPCPINEADERERLLAMEKRSFLIQSRGIIEKVYENFKKAGLLRMADQVKFGRSDQWGDDARKTALEGKLEDFDKNMVQVIDCIAKTTGPNPGVPANFNASLQKKVNFILPKNCDKPGRKEANDPKRKSAKSSPEEPAYGKIAAKNLKNTVTNVQA
ncbi:tubulin-tyrosine ligase activity [Nesidiocoris tenuis]|uniref:Tubulin-tyrosine ligase activity n=1 Tax=Nesidiocoris tenuis TaxID=355587 RepID=A0ABN7B106_9HEMI|nr:tubulin-tyrosine ligase activity [Nesidiocoris tenuis]